MNIDRQRTFVVGVDATEEGGRALDWTRAAAGAQDSIVAVHAWDLPMMVGLDTAAVVPVVDMGEIAERGLAELLERLDDPRIEPLTPQGHAGRALVSVADDRSNRSIGMTSRSVNPCDRSWLTNALALPTSTIDSRSGRMYCFATA